jgi:hypothetical protein
MKGEFLKRLAVLICLSAICFGCISLVSAQDKSENKVVITHSSPEQVKLINELWGSDITIGDYMQKVHPEQLSGVSDEVKNEMYQRKMIWPEEKNGSSPLEKRDPLHTLRATLSVSGDLTIYWNRIYYTSTATCSSAASYIYVEAFLKNAADSTVGSTSSSSRDLVNTVTCYNTVAWPPTGYYHVHSYGYTITPSSEGSAHSSSKYFAG